MAHYALGEYSEAADEYEQAFRLKQDPALLYNAAQAYRLAGNHEKAIILYRNYIVLYPTEPNVDVAREQIEKLKQSSRTEPRPSIQPAPATPSPNLSAPAPKAEPASVVTASAERPPRHKNKALMWGLVIGGVAAVALAVGLGVGLTEHPRDPVPTMGAWTLK